MSEIDKLILGDEKGDLTTVTTFTIDVDAKTALEYLTSINKINKKISKQEIFKTIIKNARTNYNLIDIKPINIPKQHKQRLKRKYIDMINSVCNEHNISRDEYISSVLIKQYDNIKSFLNNELNDIQKAYTEIVSLNKKSNKSLELFSKNNFLSKQYLKQLETVKKSITIIENKLESFLKINKESK